MQASRLLSRSPSSPSFSGYYSVNLTEIAARVVEELGSQRPDSDEDDHVSNGNAGECDQGDFEFAFFHRDIDSDTVVTADQIFFNGQIRPLYKYPLSNSNSFSHDVFSDPETGKFSAASKSTPSRHHRPALRKLMSEERESALLTFSSSKADDELNGVPPETYCLWTPQLAKADSDDPASPSVSKTKNYWTGFSKRWKLRDLLYARSSSEGEETLLLLEPINKGQKSNGVEERLAVKDTSSAEDSGSISNVSRNSSGRASAREEESSKRQTYLPYRKDLVGILSNFNGLSRKLHPF